jgi:hypothetical protein
MYFGPFYDYFGCAFVHVYGLDFVDFTSLSLDVIIKFLVVGM